MDLLKQVAAQVTIPLTVGGGIDTIESFDRALEVGADKVSINSGALKNPELIDISARKFGNERVVLAMDVKRSDGEFRVFTGGGRVETGISALDWAVEGQNRGAGELVINSIDTDGVKQGFDIEMLSAICNLVNIPMVASGGAGKREDFLELFEKCGVDAGLAASIFHQKELLIAELKEYLNTNGVPVNMS